MLRHVDQLQRRTVQVQTQIDQLIRQVEFRARRARAILLAHEKGASPRLVLHDVIGSRSGHHRQSRTMSTLFFKPKMLIGFQ